MPHAIMKFNNGPLFFVEYRGTEYDDLTIEGIYLQNSQVNLVDFLSDSVIDKASEEVYDDFMSLQHEIADYERARNRDADADKWC
jgi:hypothetical protein